MKVGLIVIKIACYVRKSETLGNGKKWIKRYSNTCLRDHVLGESAVPNFRFLIGEHDKTVLLQTMEKLAKDTWNITGIQRETNSVSVINKQLDDVCCFVTIYDIEEAADEDMKKDNPKLYEIMRQYKGLVRVEIYDDGGGENRSNGYEYINSLNKMVPLEFISDGKLLGRLELSVYRSAFR